MFDKFLVAILLYIIFIAGLMILSLILALIATTLALFLAITFQKCRYNAKNFIRIYENIDKIEYEREYFITKGVAATLYDVCTIPIQIVGMSLILLTSTFSTEKGLDMYHRYNEIIHLPKDNCKEAK